MEIEINQLKVGVHQIRPLRLEVQHTVSATAASRPVGRRIRKAMRPGTAVPPFFCPGVPDRKQEDEASIGFRFEYHLGSKDLENAI